MRMSADTTRMEARPKRKRDAASIAVFTGLAANALTAFLIQAWMTYGFGTQVWRMPTELCVALIAMVDVFAINFMILTYLLRGHGWRRSFVSLVFLLGIGAQLFAAEIYADHKNWSTEVRWFSALPALFLALSLEGVIMWRTARSEGPRPKREPTTITPKAAIERHGQHPGQAPKIQRPGRADKAPTPPPVPSGAGAPPRQTRRSSRAEAAEAHRAAVVARVLDDGQPAAVVAKAMGEKPRNVQNWVKAERERRDAGAPRTPPVTSPPVTPAPVSAPAIARPAAAPSDAPVPIGK